MEKSQKITPRTLKSKAQISAGALVLNSKQELLLMHQTANKYWEFPKGKQENKETIWETAIRELKEETGITKFTRLRRFKEIIEYRFQAPEKIIIEKKVVYFLLRTPQAVKLSAEHDAYKWVNLQTAKKYVKHKNQLQLVERLIKYLKYAV